MKGIDILARSFIPIFAQPLYLSSLTCQLCVSFICKPVELPQSENYICNCELKFKTRKNLTVDKK